MFAPDELDELKAAAAKGLTEFTETIWPLLNDSKISAYLNYVLYRTLGPTLPNNAADAASLWGFCQRLADQFPKMIQAAGHKGEGPALGNDLFSAILNGDSGVIILKGKIGDATQWRRPDKKVNLLVGEMSDALDELSDYKVQERPDDFPLLLCAGERRSYTANTIIRDPQWRKSNNPISLSINPVDAQKLHIKDAEIARLVTKRGQAEVQVELDERLQTGTISLPNGQGLFYPDSAGNNQITGVYLNELTDIHDRDPFVGTPWHKHVAAHLEPINKTM